MKNNYIFQTKKIFSKNCFTFLLITNVWLNRQLDSFICFYFECVAIFSFCLKWTKKIPRPLKRFQGFPDSILEDCLVNPSIHIPKNSIKKASMCWNIQATGCSSQGSDLLMLFLPFSFFAPSICGHLPENWLIFNPLVLFYTLPWVVLFFWLLIL